MTAAGLERYIRASGHTEISFVSTSPDADNDNEDILFALYMRDRLLGNPVDESALKQRLSTTAAYGFLKSEAGVPETDFDLCLDFGRFDFAIRGIMQDGRLTLVKQSA